jgi:catechol 2,3-dioxygenase-like lactoylglutathione lyase family enzyme
MAPKGIYYLLAFVSDMQRSKEFYGETLGWQLVTEEGNVAGFSFGTGYLVLHADNRPAAARRYGGELVDRPWGERHFSFADPDGYQWFYGQATR